MNVKDILRSIALEYPKDLVGYEIKDIDRIAFHIGLVLERKGTDIRIADIGGGMGLFSVGCAALGMKSILIDDFRDEINLRVGDSILEIHKSYGVDVISEDVIKGQIGFEPQSIDVVTSFDSMEHWHYSPKKLFKSLKKALKPGGLFVLGTPNCVNLRKRITVPLGYGKWSRMAEWYEQEIFRGHVREPDVNDLLYIAKDMSLKDVEILGANWLGYRSEKRMIRFATMMFDYILRLRPSLCSNIYMIGRI
jgi:SAM-dependent methyltransferase